MKTIAYFDCYRGISGDMVLGAFLDLGVSLEDLRKELAKLNLNGIELAEKKLVKNGQSGTSIEITLAEDGLPVDHPDRQEAHSGAIERRNLDTIRKLILDSALDSEVKEHALSILLTIAEAEAAVHNRPIEEVEFHEAGALDSIVDVCGAAICFHLLGVEQVYCSTVYDGSGYIMCHCGRLPVPVPAVARMLPGSGIRLEQLEEVKTEMVTPTGFGILKGMNAICRSVPDIQNMRAGVGFGKRDTGQRSGLRIVLGTVEQ